ncbi:bifunctional acetate--CoA ligase family protein/GNAT family N-acetyltransferase [Cellulomonas bogoriensis]|uniref:GCN5 family acetyltransferase n=1 Tax=Cellulomonas bogoriensis 69B4 = DSM 16987 TaxID=1386082 RepID=A0A0A0C4L6_9CELL|nr:GNAT family N-acetyltransferase [Cellulomonas bogoriensis]KGM14274.1 GCN5 family acetyltransferase [Cellulomonas bogoriensis 69B4 = DSM 16987]
MVEEDQDRDHRYPVHWEADVVLRDGGTAHVRPIRTADGPALQQFHVGQSERSTYFRFFAPLARLPERDLARFTHVDHVDRVALVAVTGHGDHERIIAVARYDRVEGRTAEAAFNVADDHHGRGLGSVLLEHLAAAARERGIRRFTAEVLPQNAQMLGIFREAGYEVTQHLDDGIVTVTFGLDPTERSLAVMADREHRAEARSVHTLLSPRAVLVVSDDHGAPLAEAVLASLTATDPAPRPEVHHVGPAQAPPSVRTWPRTADVPPVDLLVLAVRSTHARTVLQDPAATARAVVVLSDGFAETGTDGLTRQRDLVRTAHAAGMRLLGPGSFGFLRRTTDTTTVNATLTAHLPPDGGTALFCQSAPLGVGMLESARRRRLGVSTFVSSGNRADVSGNDLMQFWTEDPRTDVVALYLESIGNPRKFTRVARRLAAAKPVVVLTAGRSGHVVPAGHAIRRTRAPRQALDEIMRQSGVLRVDTPHQLLDVTQLLAHQPLPRGRRVAVVASSEALTALVAEAASSAGLTVTRRTTIPQETPTGTTDDLDTALAEVYAAQDCDSVVVVHVPVLGDPDPTTTACIAQRAAISDRTTVACVTGLHGVTEGLTAAAPDGRPHTVPAYATPEDGVLALAAASRYAAWRATDRGAPLAPTGVDRTRARALVEAMTPPAGEVRRLEEHHTRELLACYGVHVWQSRAVRTTPEAVAAAHEVGWPVALKCAAEHLRHRIDLGGVRLDVATPDELTDDLQEMRDRLIGLGVPDPTFEVQKMAPGGVACVVRTAEDPRFGPVVSFGLAGDAIDLLGDVAYAVAPLTDVDVSEMIRTVRAGPRLFGYRGLPPVDVPALEDVLARVATMAEDLPALHNLELHPVVASEGGANVLAARIELAEAGRADGPRRALV